MLQHHTSSTTAPEPPYDTEQLNKPPLPTAVTAIAHLDTGAESCTAPLQLIQQSTWAKSIHRAPAGTGLRYGSGEVIPIPTQATIGTTQVLLTPNHCNTSLLGAFPITDAGHNIIFTSTYSQIEDSSNQYQLTFPKDILSPSWTIPLNALEQLAHLRTQHPQKFTQSDRTTDPPLEDPTDPIAIADSGAETCTAPLSSIAGTPYHDNIHTAPPHSDIRDGNSDIITIEQQITIGSTTVQLNPTTTPHHSSQSTPSQRPATS
jgi:hypothetical protein